MGRNVIEGWVAGFDQDKLKGGVWAQEAQSLDRAAGGYKNLLASAVRGLWQGAISYDQFFDSFGVTIQRGLANAWLLGAQAGGITPDEFTQEEQVQLKRHILSDRMFMGGFADQIDQTSKANGGKLAPLLSRLDTWVNHWWEVYGLANAMAAKDVKMMFVQAFPTKEKCRSCLGLMGRVYRNSVWLANNAVPPSRRYDCGGWRCGHRTVATDQRVTPGPFPRRLLN